MSYSNYLHTGYPQTTPDLLEGVIVYQKRVITVPNSQGVVNQSYVVTPDVTVQEITTYRLLEVTTGRVITFVSDATPTGTEVSNGLKLAWKADSILNGIATVDAPGSGTMTVTNRSGFTNIQLELIDGGSTPTNKLAVANTAAVNGSQLNFGVGLAVGTDGKPVLPSAALSSTNVFAGVVAFALADIESNYSTVAEKGFYPPKSAVNLLVEGQIAVRVLTAVNPTLPVFLGFGAEAGKWRGSAATNYSQVTNGVSWQRPAPIGALALLNVNLP